MWRLAVTLLICCIPVVAIYAMGYVGLIDLPQKMTTGMPRQLFLTLIFSVALGLVICFLARAIQSRIKCE